MNRRLKNLLLIFIKVPVLSQESARSCIYVLGVSILSVSRIFQWDFNCSDSVVSFVFTFYVLYFQTTFGEMIMIQNNGDVIGLSRFIITRLLGNPDIACEFSHPSVPHLYKDGNSIISPVLKS